MKPLTRRLLVGTPVFLALLFVAAYLLLNFWLEGAGGRQALERALQERIGMPVRLEGEFNVMLLPTIGVSGTELVVGEHGAASELLRSGEYAVSLDFAALLDRRLVIGAVGFGEGVLHLERWPEAETAATDVPETTIQLPEIGFLEIRDFRVTAAAEDDQPYLLQELKIESFAPNRSSPFRLEVAGFGAWVGSLSWNPEQAVLEVTADGAGFWSGVITLRAVAQLAAATGAVAADWTGVQADAQPGRQVRLALSYAIAPAGLRLTDIRLAADQLLIEGAGCLLPAARPALHLELSTGRVDADALPDLAALTGPADANAADPMEQWDFHVRLTAAEMMAGGAVARQAVLQIGNEPDCSRLEAEAAQ
jgi:hypothetical protein